MQCLVSGVSVAHYNASKELLVKLKRLLHSVPLFRYIEEVRDNDETFVEAFKFAQTQVWRDMLSRVHSSESNIIEYRETHYGICQINCTPIVWEVKSINRDKTAHML